MSFKKTIVSLTAMAATAGVLVSCSTDNAFAPGGSPIVPADRTFLNFSGVCQGGVSNPNFWGTSLGWNRHDVGWGSVVSRDGKGWNQQKIDKICASVLEHHQKGVEYLPIFAYGSGKGAETIPDQSFDFAGSHYEFKRGEDGNFVSSRFMNQSVNGKMEKVKVGGRSISAKRMSQRFVPDDQVKDWEKYIRKMVTVLRAEPYNLKYFQIWNEAHPSSSFWYGDMDTYMRNVHKPAAKIIHELGGKVVYGGWICGAPASEFVKYMDKNDAWDTVDVLDMHYFPLAGMDYLRKALDERGLQDKGIWQTELGFSSNPNYIGNLYPRIIYWGLKNDWSWGDKYKLFYFAFGSPDSPKAYGYRRSLMLGNKVNFSGQSLNNLAALLSGAPMEIYEPVTSVPALKAEINEFASSMESFKVGSRIVTAVHMLGNNHAKIFVDWKGDGDTMHIDYEAPQFRVNYPELDPDKVAKIERVSMYGNRVDFTERLEKTSDGGIAVNIPIREPDSKEFKYTDMPEAFLPQVFYVEVTLKGEAKE